MTDPATDAAGENPVKPVTGLEQTGGEKISKEVVI